MWSVTVEENGWLLPTTLQKLAALTPDSLPAEWKSESHDKAFLIAVEEAGSDFIITGREWDQTAQQVGGMQSRRIAMRSELPHAVFTLAHDLFRPLLAVDRVTAGVATVSVKAGALTPADPTKAQLKVGQFWQPFIRYRTSKGEVDKLQFVPWTMLQVEEVAKDTPAHGSVKVVSGLRAALPSRKRSRTEVLARALEPAGDSTELPRCKPNYRTIRSACESKANWKSWKRT
jgi:hypothetical protein